MDRHAPLCLRGLFVVLAWFFAVVPGAAADRSLSIEDFFLQMIDLDRLPYLEEGIRCAQASSYDRRSRVDPETGEQVDWGANGDAGNYISIDSETNEALMAEIEGPGCVYRIWSANPQGKLRFYLDGAETPSLELEFKDMFTGVIPPFVPPFVWARDEGGRASDSYLPIPFAKSCRVTADQPHGQYYHIGYQTFPASWEVQSFRLPLSEREQKTLDRVSVVLEACGEDPQPSLGLRRRRGTLVLKPGAEERFIAERGPGIVHEFRIKIESGERPGRRTLWLTGHWDGERDPSIAAALGDFFGAGFAPGPYESLPLSMTEEGFVSFWRMPFHQSAQFYLKNEGSRPTTIAYEIGILPRRPLPVNTAFFHAKWRREPRGGTFDYPFLEAEGRGRFVGAALFIDNVRGGWWGEGDEKFTVDGELFPSTFGTGSEDYFGDAWGIRYFVNPYHGCPVTVGRAQSCYRWHITDSVPFARSFSATIENYAFEEPDPNDFASMAYWYQMEPHQDRFEFTPVDLRRPLPERMERGVQEAEAWFRGRRMPAGVSLIGDDDVGAPLSFGRGARLEGKPGQAFDYAVVAPRDDRYSVEIGFGPGSEGTAELRVDGRPVGDRVFLAAGENRGEIVLRGSPDGDGRAVAVIDFVRVASFRNFIRAWSVVGPFDNTENVGRRTVYPPEEKIDLDAMYEGKGGAAISWREVNVAADGRVDLRGFLDPKEDTVAYAYAEIVAPAAAERVLLLGSDDGVKVWLNGEVVHVNEMQRAMAVDDDSVVLPLREGRNALLLKVDQGAGGWEFCARVVDRDDALEFSSGR